jgi:dTDP-4-amino-4,6-dideoxygalactose transaminase
VIAKLRSLRRHSYAVPWCVPAWGLEEFGATVASLATGRVTSGPSVDRFTAEVRAFLGVRFALPVNRGRTAITIALRAMGIGRDDDVVLPSYVCQSVLDGVLSAGANPVFADVDATLNVTADTVARALTPTTRAVIVAHLFGTPAPIDEIERLLEPRRIALIDDAAQALGVRRAGRLVGTFGQCGIVSCGPGKPLAGAAGGMLVTNDEKLYVAAVSLPLPSEPARQIAGRTIGFWIWRRLRRYTLPLRVLVSRLAGEPYELPHRGARLANLDAAIASVQLARLDQHAAERRAHVQILLGLLSLLPGQAIGDLSPNSAMVKLVWLLPPGSPAVGDVVDVLAHHGIEAQHGYVPVHIGHAADARFPMTVGLWRRVLCVPLETRPTSSAPIDFGVLARVAGDGTGGSPRANGSGVG